MSEHKTITINPNLFTIDKKRTSTDTTKTRKKKPDSSFLKPNNIKKDFLARIKDHQRNKELQHQVINTTSLDGSAKPIQEPKSDLKEAIGYFSTLVKDKRDMRQKKQRRKQQGQQQGQSQGQQQGQPQGQQQKTPYLNKTIKHNPTHDHTPIVSLSPFPYNDIMEEIKITDTPTSTIKLNVPTHTPTYGCLKSGKLPTYKQYHKTVSNRNFNNVSNIKLKDNIIDPSHKELIQNNNDIGDSNAIKINTPTTMPSIAMPSIAMPSIAMPSIAATDTNIAVKNDVMPEDNIEKFNINRKLIKRKIKLGKDTKKNIVGILIKNRKTRKIISTEHAKLKLKSLVDIKKYLRDHGLLEIGSTAPMDVLHVMYENAMMSGKIKNNNEKTMLHNFVNAEKEL